MGNTVNAGANDVPMHTGTTTTSATGPAVPMNTVGTSDHIPTNTATHPTGIETGHHEPTGVNASSMPPHEKAPVLDEKTPVVEDDDEDEDIDALIDELESQDVPIEDDDEEAAAGEARAIDEKLLQTDTGRGLTTAEVEARRKKFGLNQMKEEKENMILKFLMYFVGPIQFVMEVSLDDCCALGEIVLTI